MHLHHLRVPLAALTTLSLLAPAAEAQQGVFSYTGISGYVQLTVPGSSLGAISATLQNKSDHTSNADINNDWTPTVPQTPPTPDIPAQQTLTVPGAGWTADQWASGYLCYITDSSQGEEAFLVLGNTADTLTVQTNFNLLDASRPIPATTSISLRKAQTIGNLLGVGVDTDFTSQDKIYLWNGAGWTTYFVDANGNWRKIGSFFLANDDVVFPDEGLFVQRNTPADITLTFFGDVPDKAQITTMPGPGLQFVSSRYPVETTVGQLGFENLPNWQQNDNVYLWNGSGWVTYYFNPNFNGGVGAWFKVGSLFPAGGDIIPPDSALFVSRSSVAGLAESANFHTLPYTP